jgi:hypothetical protein
MQEDKFSNDVLIKSILQKVLPTTPTLAMVPEMTAPTSTEVEAVPTKEEFSFRPTATPI